jgi:hypothetical protein
MVQSAGAASGESVMAAMSARPRTVDVVRWTGIDLELRILHVSIEFPWLKALPVSFGRRIVISLFADEDERAGL